MKFNIMILVVLLFVFLTSCQVNSKVETLTEKNIIQDQLIHDEQLNDQNFLYKISYDLLAIAQSSTDNDMVSTYIFLKQIEPAELRMRLLNFGIDEDIYCDEDLFQAYVLSLYQNDIEKINEERMRYQTLRLQVIKEITAEILNDFVEFYDICDDQIIYASSYTTTLIVEIPIGMLRLIAQNDQVSSLSLYTNDDITSDILQ